MVLTALSVLAVAQSEGLLEDLAANRIENGGESEAEYLADMVGELSTTPLNINLADEEHLNACGLFSPFQVFGILKYREKYGSFFSIYELASIPGFRQEQLQMIAPLLSCATLERQQTNPRPEGLILSNMAIKFPEASGFRKDDSLSAYYPGSPIKAATRMKYRLTPQWSAAASYEKDPGETWHCNKQPEHFAGYLQYTSKKILKEAIIGNFRIHRGMGLVHGLGFNSRGSGTILNGFRRAYAKPFASMPEYDYLSGIYAEAAFSKWTADGFFSLKSEELSFHRFNDATDLFEMIRKTGMHRSPSELNGIGLGRNRSAGASVNRTSDHWTAGVAISSARLMLSHKGLDSLKREESLYTDRAAASFYGVVFGRLGELFFEAALDHHLSPAMITGTTIELNPALTASFSFRNYRKGYTGIIPNAYGAGNAPENESGATAALLLTPFVNARLRLNTDLSHKPALSDEDDNGFSSYNTLQLNCTLREGPEMELKISGRTKQLVAQNSHPGKGTYQIETQSKFRLQYRHELQEDIKIQGRVEFSMLDDGNEKYFGHMFYQQLSFTLFKGSRLTYRFLQFESNNWDNRLYTHEPGVRYSFLFPAWYGKGTRNLLVFSSDVTPRTTLRGKIGMTSYAHKRETGSGHDIRPGNIQVDAEVQLQIDF